MRQTHHTPPRRLPFQQIPIGGNDTLRLVMRRVTSNSLRRHSIEVFLHTGRIWIHLNIAAVSGESICGGCFVAARTLFNPSAMNICRLAAARIALSRALGKFHIRIDVSKTLTLFLDGFTPPKRSHLPTPQLQTAHSPSLSWVPCAFFKPSPHSSFNVTKDTSQYLSCVVVISTYQWGPDFVDFFNDVDFCISHHTSCLAGWCWLRSIPKAEIPWFIGGCPKRRNWSSCHCSEALVWVFISPK